MTEPTGSPGVAGGAADAAHETATAGVAADVTSDDIGQAAGAGSARIRRRARVGPVVPPLRTAPEAVPAVLDPDDEPLSPVASVISYTTYSTDGAEDDSELTDSAATATAGRRNTEDPTDAGSEAGGATTGRRFGRARGRRPPEVADRALRGLVTTRGTQVSWSSATRARVVSTPTQEDIAEAEQEVVVVRRHYTPREPLPTRGGQTAIPSPGQSSGTPGRAPIPGPIPGSEPTAPETPGRPGASPAEPEGRGGREPGRSRLRFPRRQSPPQT